MAFGCWLIAVVVVVVVVVVAVVVVVVYVVVDDCCCIAVAVCLAFMSLLLLLLHVFDDCVIGDTFAEVAFVIDVAAVSVVVFAFVSTVPFFGSASS